MSIAPPVAAASVGQPAHDVTPRAVSSLMYACQQGDVDRVRRILRAQPTAYERRDRTGKTALHYCCTSDNICAAQAADLLVMAAPDLVEARDEDGFTPLHLAVIAGNMPLVTFLLANSADVNAVDSERHTVVHWAAVCGETAALRAVLSAGAPVSTPDVHGGFPLHYAAQMCGGDKDSNLGLQVLQTLLQHPDVKVNVEDGDGRQPLLWAASAGSAKAVLALIRAGATVDAPDKDGLTALHCAASRGHTDCIDTLLTLCGMSSDVIDSNGCTALHYSVTLGHADATALLLAHGADPNKQDRKGRSPAHCGCAKGQFETVKMIGAQEANLWLRNARGDLPLHEAAASGRRDLVKWLLEARPSQVNARNNDGRCPLHLAALNDNADMCKILLDAGAQLNPVLRTSKNVFMTPLDCALQRGFRSTAKYLQVHGGIPANRLGAVQAPTSIPNGGLHLKTRGTTPPEETSDSERENDGEQSEAKVRRKHKRKFTEKSAGENNKKMDEAKKDGVTYNSEVKITNNYGGINIEKNGEIIIGDGTPLLKAKEKLNPTESKEGNDANSNAQMENVIETVQKTLEDIQIFKPGVAIDENIEEIKSLASTIEQTAKNITREVETIQQNLQDDGKTEKTPPQRSLSAEEGEKSKNLVVEAAVHEPPKPKKGERRDFKRQDTMREKDEEESKEQKQVGGDDAEGDDQSETTVAKDEPSTEERPKELASGTETEAKIEEEKPEVKIEEVRSIETSELPTKEVVAERESTEKVVEIEEKIAQTQDDVVIKPVDDVISPGAVEAQTEKTSVTDEVNKEPGEDEPEQPPQEDSKIQTEEAKKPEDVQTKEGPGEQDPEIQTQQLEGDANLKIQIEDDGTPKTRTKETEDEDVALKVDAQTKDLDGAHVQTEDVANVEAETETTKPEGDREELQIQAEPEVLKTQATIPEPKTETKDAEGVTAVNVENKDEQVTVERKSFVKRKKPKTDAEETGKPKAKEDEDKPTRKAKEDEERPTRKPKVKEVEGEERRKPKVTEEDEKPKRKRPKATKAIEKIIEVTPVKEKRSERRGKRSPRESSAEESSDESSETPRKEHKSFTVLDDDAGKRKASKKTRFLKKGRSRSDDSKFKDADKRDRRSKIPTPVFNLKKDLSKSDRYLNRKTEDVPSLPHLLQKASPRSESNLSAPLGPSVYSDNERSASDDAQDATETRSATRKRRFKKRIKIRDSKSAGSDYESSNLIDSGFEPSPRSSRIPKWRNMSERGVNMTSITQTIQSNIRRYHLERKVFQHLLELKRLQIRSGQHNEAMLVKRAIDDYHNSCASTVGAGRYVPQDYSFKSFEKFLYHSLRRLQKNNGTEHLEGLPESPLLCTQSTHRCLHATHAYTGIPCAAYLPRIDHHSIPKIGFCKPSGFLPHINPKKAVTLELCHGNDKQVISLPTDRLDQNKRYYVTFTVKGQEHQPTTNDDAQPEAHRHAKSI